MIEKIPFEIEILTPVHIGAGDAYIEGYDFKKHGDGLVFVDQALFYRQFFALPANTQRALEKALNSGKIIDIVVDNAAFRDAVRYRVSAPKDVREVKKQIREASGLPLLPGSSLKGSLMTAIVADIARRKKATIDREVQNLLLAERADDKLHIERADDKLLADFLGATPNVSLGRLLRVGDVVFTHAETRPVWCRTVRLDQNNRLSRKDFINGVEALMPGGKGIGSLSFDTRLRRWAVEEHGFTESFNMTADDLWKALAERSQALLQAEIEFLERYEGDWQQDLLAWAHRLLQRQQQGDELLLPVGWGIGWRGMTGMLLERNLHGPDGRRLREALRLATRHLNFPFPKSRRLALVDQHAQPLGWVALRRLQPEQAASQVEDAVAVRVERLRAGAATYRHKAAAEQLRQEEEARRREAEERARLEAENPWLVWLRQLKDINDWGALKQFLDRSEVQEHQGREDLATAVREAAERVYHQRPDKWTDERTDQVNQWLQPAGLTFETARQQAEEEIPEDVATIEALKDFDAYQKAGLDLNALSRPALEALRNKMHQWGCANKKAKKNKQQALKEVVQALKTK